MLFQYLALGGTKAQEDLKVYTASMGDQSIYIITEEVSGRGVGRVHELVSK